MSSQYLSASITAIHGKQFEHRQTALPPYSTTILVCQTKCNVFLPPKIIPAAYMGSPRMGPNLPYKPATPNRKTSHTRTSRSRKTSHTRTTRSSLFPLIIIHVRRYGESSRGPYRPWGRACARVCVSDCLGRRGAPSVADRQEDRKTGRQGGQPDTPSRTGSARASPDLTSHARLPTLPACPPYPISCRARMCHIVNRSATRATRKTAFCQALLPFSDLSKRYTLIHSNLHVY